VEKTVAISSGLSLKVLSWLLQQAAAVEMTRISLKMMKRQRLGEFKAILKR